MYSWMIKNLKNRNIWGENRLTLVTFLWTFFDLLAIKSFAFERGWWMLSQKRFVPFK